MRRVRVRVSGLVQGVGYRYSAARVAEGRGVSGWVRNRPDGSVQAELEGPALAIDEVLGWMRQGPDGARVDRVTVDEIEPVGGAGFELRPTA
ncbi:acylphosphatase [Microbacterium sp. GXF7504]